MVRTLRDGLRPVLDPHHLRRTAAITLLVGTWLTAFNQGDALLAGVVSRTLLARTALNYLTPFVVANWGLLSRRSPDNGGGPGTAE